MNQPDFAIALPPVLIAFEKLDVPFYISGALASSAHGEYRATVDVDIIADLKTQDVEAFVGTLGEAYYANIEAIRDAIAHHSRFNLLHYATFLKIDIFPLQPRPYDQKAMQRRILVNMGSDEETVKVYLASPEDVVLAKLQWYRNGNGISDQQWRDIEGVLKLQSRHGQLDKAYLRHWASEIKVDDLLEQALDDSGVEQG